jgi:uncharacterized protein HemY
MKSIGDYVRGQARHPTLAAHFTMADNYERAATHQREALRLFQAGDSQQAEMHCNIAREHAQAAIELHPAFARKEPVH